VLIGFTGIMLFFVIKAIRAYFDYPSQTSVSVIFEWPHAFPEVTICNYSPLRYDRFIGPFLNYTNTFNITNTTDTNNFTTAQTSYIFQFLSYKLNRSESLNDLFYPLDGMMISCNYNGMSCSAVNFTSFITPTYGLCYTFNAKLKDAVNDGIRYNSDNGQTGILQVRLYAHEHQYVPYISQGNCNVMISLF
jgi:Amiloride-sensitive sodium channel